MIDVYLLYGPPGVGKGTISERIPKDHCLGIGVLLRNKKMGGDGKLISDDYVNQLVEAELKHKKKYVVLDGYPRTLGQVDFLKTIPDIHIVRVYALTCPDNILVERLSLRQTCSCGATYHPTLKPSKLENTCDLCGHELFRRSDDNPKIVQKRLSQFHKETEPILKHFDKLVRYIDSEHNFKASVLSVVSEIMSEQNINNNIGNLVPNRMAKDRIHD